ncbi:SAM-dependent methyltransferase [Litorivivens lipolytica]|uniref:SAM-dependent methyltransferase n=1 Tax=Litorivivens lipolytica TaxID=1524264 RepID=A0A7W4W402_9GAMM|nr:SAM-dependent methyltransferase [Litorivivens lipolytica]
MSTWRRQAPDAELLPKLKAWFDSELGRQLLNEERVLIEAALEGAFGHSLLELGLSGRTLASRPDAIRRHYCMGPPLQRDLGKHLDVMSGYADLPVANESQDVVIVHHLLEFIANPHNMLRELERVIVPHGRLLIVGFNPLSLLGLKLHAVGRLSSNSVWRQHWLTLYRLEDWLGLLGFKVDKRWYGFHRLPVNKPHWLNKPLPMEPVSLRKVPMGGTFLLSATKYRAPVTPVRPRWIREPVVNVRPLGAARQGNFSLSEHNQ